MNNYCNSVFINKILARSYYSEDNIHQIFTVESEKDFGVTVDDEGLQFKSHINQITHKANSALGTIKRTLIPGMLIQYHYYIPHLFLDYASIVWNPYLMGSIRNLRESNKGLPN